LLEIVQLVGSDALPDKEQLTLDVARLIREFVLQQNAYHEIDTYCTIEKSYHLMKLILKYNDIAQGALANGIRVKTILGMKTKDSIAEAKFTKDWKQLLASIEKDMEREFAQLHR
jgi:V/A-type H+-transporting ATPase subunit A